VLCGDGEYLVVTIAPGYACDETSGLAGTFGWARAILVNKITFAEQRKNGIDVDPPFVD
jgi:hypothetical protein